MADLRLGGEMVHVPHKEGGMALSDVMAGTVQFMFYRPAAVPPQLKSGKLHARDMAQGATRADLGAFLKNGLIKWPTLAKQAGAQVD